ncbi:MAG TPA: hypothetical protein VGY55_16925 [Pirellulales bacterium]|nr:hypothetical protein [Pirellulales bacterium]
MHRGKLVILLMVLVGCAMGGLSIAYHHGLARRAIAWWGSDNVELIADAPRVAAVELRPASQADSSETAAIGSRRYVISRRTDVANAEGIDHLRHELLDDRNFVWQASSAGEPTWRFGLEFQNAGRSLIVAFDASGRLVGRSDGGEVLAIAPLVTGWRDFFAEQFKMSEVGGPAPRSGKEEPLGGGKPAR